MRAGAVCCALVLTLLTGISEIPRVTGRVAAVVPVILELELAAPAADDLALRMQEAVDAVRAALGVAPAAARADGVSIYPTVSSTGKVLGYAAVERLTLPLAGPTAGPAVARARSAAAAKGAEAFVIPSGTPRRSGDTWEAQWLQFG